VLRVVDGDTVDIVDETRARLRIRVLGIDTPEVRKPGYSVGCWGPQASQFAQNTLAGQRVAVIADRSQAAHDAYGRTLAYLEKPGNWDYSVEAARAGAARSYTYDHSPTARAPQIQAAEAQAEQARRGLWGPPCNGHSESIPLK
jgi:micrococcal nuclease